MKTLKTHIRFLFGLVLSAVVLTPSALAQSASHAGEHVFYASHSLMWYVPPLLEELATAAGIEGHQTVGLQTMGASRTIDIWNVEDYWNNAKRVLNNGEVSLFTMSPIQFPDPGVENFVSLGLAHNPNMRFVVQLSWGGGDTDNQDFPTGAWDNVDREKTPEQLQHLYERNIAAGELQANDLNGRYGGGARVVALAPTAQALVELRTRIYNHQMPGIATQGELFVDPAHPSAPLEALNTYVHFAVIYGQSPVGLPMLSKLRDANRPWWDQNTNRVLQEIAWETVRNYSYSGVQVPEPSLIGMSLGCLAVCPGRTTRCLLRRGTAPAARFFGRRHCVDQ